MFGDPVFAIPQSQTDKHMRIIRLPLSQIAFVVADSHNDKLEVRVMTRATFGGHSREIVINGEDAEIFLMAYDSITTPIEIDNPESIRALAESAMISEDDLRDAFSRLVGEDDALNIPAPNRPRLPGEGC